MVSGIAAEPDEGVVVEVRGYRKVDRKRKRPEAGASSTIGIVCRKAEIPTRRNWLPTGEVRVLRFGRAVRRGKRSWEGVGGKRNGGKEL